MTDLGLERPIAMVTGAASGIGRATGVHLRGLGWQVVGADLRPSPFDRSEILDIADRSAFGHTVDTVEAELGSISLLVNAAGFDQEIAIESLTSAMWDRMLSVLLGGTVNGCAAVLPHMTRRRHGSIVAVSSEIGLAGCALYTHYSAAKGR